MSRATRQASALLSIIGGCLYEIDRKRMLSRIDMRELVTDTHKTVIVVLNEWPKDKDDRHTINWVGRKIKKWEPHVAAVRDYHRLVVLVKVCERCLADLLDKVRDPYKKELLQRLRVPLGKLHDFADWDGSNFRAYEKCDELMDYLYKLIEWE